MAESLSLVIGLVLGFGLDRILIITGSSKVFVRRSDAPLSVLTDEEVPDSPAELEPPRELADVRFGDCHPTLYDPEDYDVAMQCPGLDGTGHDLMPGERVMVIENAAAPDGRWLVCSAHVFEAKVWGADA